MNRFYYCVITFLVVLLGQVEVSYQFCTKEDINKCIKVGLIDVFQVQDKNSLKKFCSDMQDTLQCLKMCVTGKPEVDKPIFKLFGELETFLNEMCAEDSQMAKEYLENAKCFGKANSEMEKCDTESPIVQKSKEKSVFEFATFTEHAETSKEICCSIFKNIACRIEKAEVTCGNKVAGNVVENIMSIVFGSVLEPCKQLNIKDCNGGSNVLPSFLMILAAALLYIVFSKSGQ